VIRSYGSVHALRIFSRAWLFLVELTDATTPLRSDLTLYSLDLAPESDSGATSLAVTVSSVQSHQTVPLPAKLAQNAESVYLLWKGDLLAPIAGLPADQRRHVKEIKVRVKTPTPRIVSYETPEGFEAHQQTGSATLTFTSKPGVDFSTLSEQVRLHARVLSINQSA
jgi:oligosaccharyltransferase complex subunit alpha (ribophorin I)